MTEADALFALTNFLLGIADPRERMDAAMRFITALDSLYVDAWGECLNGWPNECAERA